MTRWILITGGVASGLGKGCLAAMVARSLFRAHGNVAYRKIEPCLQGELGPLPNDAFGEIVAAPDGGWWDADAARVAFFVGASADVSDQSLGHALAHAGRSAGELEPAPRLLDRVSSGLVLGIQDARQLVVEVGGTAGEIEHRVVVEALLNRLGTPTLHLHVTAWATVGGRTSTKPAEVSLRALPLPPDAIFVRNAEGTTASCRLRDAIVVADDEWPERAWHHAIGHIAELLGRRMEFPLEPDPLFEAVHAGPVPVRLVTDVSHPDAYASLATRLRTWSRGRIVILGPDDVTPAAGEIRIGERPPPASNAAVRLDIVPVEMGAAPRDRAARPDWLGSADAPAGAVHDFVRSVLELREVPPLVQGYSADAFAEIYCARSVVGSLRDHAVVDPTIERALPVGARLARSRVLDLGCGWGRWAQRLTARGAMVVGIEPSESMAARARDLRLERFELHVGSALDVPLTGSFDVILACLSLDHEAALAAVLHRLSHLLTPRGRLIASTEHPLRTATMRGGRRSADRSARVRDYLLPGPRDHGWFGRGERVRVHHRTVEEWVSTLSGAGLRVVSIHEPGDASTDAGVPRFWTLVAERPGPAPALVTIDGTAGSGKTTLARRLAATLGWSMLDTGELRRALVLRNARDPSRRAAVSTEADAWRIDGVALSAAELREAPLADPALLPQAGEEDAFIAAALGRPCVIVGRSLGRYFDAGVRAYVDAPPEVRAARHRVPAAEILARDARDRASGRLLPPDVDAVVLDGTAPLDELVHGLARRAADLGLTRPT